MSPYRKAMLKIIAALAACLLYIVGATAFVLMSPDKAEGATVKGSPHKCRGLATSARSMAQYRDMGMGWQQATEILDEEIEELKGDPESLVTDDDDAVLLRQVAHRVWHELKDKSPDSVGVEVLLACAHKTTEGKAV